MTWGAWPDPSKPAPNAHEPISGDRVSFDLVEDFLRDLARRFVVRTVAFDPWRFDRSAETLMNEGIEMLEFPQSNERMAPASQGLFDAVVETRLAFLDDEVVAGQMEAATAKQVGRDSWRLDKTAAAEPMDFSVALAIALHVAEDEEKTGAFSIRFMDAVEGARRPAEGSRVARRRRPGGRLPRDARPVGHARRRARGGRLHGARRRGARVHEPGRGRARRRVSRRTRASARGGVGAPIDRAMGLRSDPAAPPRTPRRTATRRSSRRRRISFRRSRCSTTGSRRRRACVSTRHRAPVHRRLRGRPRHRGVARLAPLPGLQTRGPLAHPSRLHDDKRVVPSERRAEPVSDGRDVLDDDHRSREPLGQRLRRQADELARRGRRSLAARSALDRAVRLGDGTLQYATRLGERRAPELRAVGVVHIRAFGTGDVGISPIGVARQAIGEQLAAEEYAGRFWQNDARPGGVVEYSKKLNDADHAEALRRWRSAHEGVKRAHMVAILDNGAQWKDVGIPMGDAQFLETRKFGVRQIATLYRVPPHKIGDLEGTTTHATIEQQALDFIVDSLRPWAVRIEQAVRGSLFPCTTRTARSRTTASSASTRSSCSTASRAAT
jgi:hypothetical protein